MAATVLAQMGFEGQPNGTTLTQLNSDDFGDTALSSVAKASDAICAFDSSHPVTGSMGLKMSQPTTGQVNNRWTWSGAQAKFAFQFGLYFDAAPSGGGVNIFRGFSGSAYTPSAFHVEVTSVGRLQCYQDGQAAVASDSALNLVGVPLVCNGLYDVAGNLLTIDILQVGVDAPLGSIAAPMTSAPSVNSVSWGINTNSRVFTWWTDTVAIGYGDKLNRPDPIAPPAFGLYVWDGTDWVFGG